MATVKSSALTQMTEMTECCICLKMFTDPRMLPCIHTFCLQCLNDMVDNSDKKPGDEIQCPMCRKEFTLPNDGVQGIQKNFFMVGMIEVRSTLNLSKMADIQCDVGLCKTNTAGTESNTSKATSRCLDCRENLCEDCSKLHKAFKVSRNHKVQKIDSDVSEEEVLKTFNVMNCDIHRGKVLDYYCAECKKVVCVSCFVESHKTHDCKDVNTVEDEFRQMIKSNADKMSTLAAELLAKKKKSESKEDFLTKIAEREKTILQRSNELKEMIEKQTKSLLSYLDEIKNRRLKVIQAREEEMNRQLIIVESFKRYCDELISKGSASDVCRSKDELLRRAEVIEEDHETYIMRPRVSWDVAFSTTDISNVLKSTNGNMVGSLEEKDERLEAFAVMIVNTGRKLSSQTVRLQCKSDNVSPLEDVPTTVTYVYFSAAAVYNNTMFITGVGENLNEIWKYNFSSGWRRCGSLVQGRRFHCAEFIDETLYICGGNNKTYDSVMNDVESYNAVMEKSIAVGQLRIGSYCSDCVAYKGSIYVFGGIDKDHERLDCVQVFNPVEQSCTLLSTPIPRPLSHMRALLWNDYVILLGHDTCFLFDFKSKTWKEKEQFKVDSETALFRAVLENERIFIISGCSTAVRGEALKQWQNNGIRFMTASSIFNNETPKWRPWGQLTQPFEVNAVPKMPLFKNK